jgi:site-specific DNA recombinase
VIAAVYARKSTEQAGIVDEQKSVARQVEHAKAYASRKGWAVADEHIYIDEGISGAEFANRPGFLRLMNALKPRPHFQVLVMSDLDRLGRESVDTTYAVKQLSMAGVKIFAYLEDREIRLDSPIETLITQVQSFGAALEREKARQRTYDALSRKAKAGHVTGGRLFGYDNVRLDSHVERRINETEAAVVRRIFDLSIDGYGVKAIAKRLNAEGAPSPRAQQGRSQSWSPSSVREVLHGDAYRGRVTWNKTRKRNQWGIHKQAPRPSSDWLERLAPDLQIVSDDVWQAVHARLQAVRGVYLKATNGQPFGRPPLGDPSKYLLTNLALCGHCQGPMHVRSRSHGTGRKHFYACSGYHLRGRTVCENNADAPMIDANEILIEALLDDVLDEDMVTD